MQYYHREIIIRETFLKFESTFLKYQAKVTEHCKELRVIADSIDKCHKDVNIANIVGSSAGIAGGILSIAGLIAAPFTLGASLILTGVGLGIGVAGGATNIGASATESVTQKNKLKKATEIIEEYQNESKAVADSLQSVCRTIQSCIQGNERDLSKGVLVGTSASLSKSLSVVSTVTAAVTKSSLRTFKAVSGILSALFIVWDIYSVVTDAKDLDEGSKTEVAAKIREAAKTIKQERKEYRKWHRELKSLSVW